MAVLTLTRLTISRLTATKARTLPTCVRYFALVCVPKLHTVIVPYPLVAVAQKTSPRRREAGGTAVGRVARARRDGRASSEARSHGAGSSRRPLRCCYCPSRAYRTPPMCCTQVAETKLVKHKHQDRCMLEMRLGHHEPLVCGGPGQAQLARHARARRRGQEASWAAQPSTSSCTRRAAVRDLQSSWPTCSTPGERPLHDLSIGMRLVSAGSELLV